MRNYQELELEQGWPHNVPSHALTALNALKVRATSNATIGLLVMQNCQKQ